MIYYTEEIRRNEVTATYQMVISLNHPAMNNNPNMVAK